MASDPLPRLNVVELLRQPGGERRVSAHVAADDLGVVHENISGPVAVELVARPTIDGIVVAGTVSVPWQGGCRRCLTDVRGLAVAEFGELFQHDATDEEAEPIVGDQIDLVPLVREIVLLETPDAPLCREDCAGICPICGTDRNVDPCDCDTTVRDDRWAALDDLRLEE